MWLVYLLAALIIVGKSRWALARRKTRKAYLPFRGKWGLLTKDEKVRALNRRHGHFLRQAGERLDEKKHVDHFSPLVDAFLDQAKQIQDYRTMTVSQLDAEFNGTLEWYIKNADPDSLAEDLAREEQEFNAYLDPKSDLDEWLYRWRPDLKPTT